ncbi:MAG: ABC transporter permease, partial [Bacteroidaceae bacterium]|nr:ABC transporter permease [Bacteroidaceae bacterium]
MAFPFYIARRYLFARKSHHAINIISIVSVLGVAVATMALVCVLSIFNGFHGLVSSLFTAFDPELKIVPVEGKTFSLNKPELKKIKTLSCVEATSASLEQRALARYNGRQAMVTLKGVDDNYSHTTDISQILYGPGRF